MSEIEIEKSGNVAVVTINCPPVNALTLASYQAIATTFHRISQMKDVNCAILTAAGNRAFCAGLDLHEFMAAKVEDDPARAVIVREAFKALRLCSIPVIAAVNGPAVGAGAVLAASCDIRIASEKATFVMPEINVGRCGGGAHMGRLLPQGLLRRMYFTGQPITAAEAFRVGFVEEVVAPDALMSTARALAEVIAAKSPIGLRMAKEALNLVEYLPVEDGYELEQRFSTRLMATEDAREAVRASLEKRPPVFKGQ
jgi:enoyl-CoA hydratase